MLDEYGNWVGDENAIEDNEKEAKESAKIAASGLDADGNWVGIPEKVEKKEAPKQVVKTVEKADNSDKKEKLPKK